MEKDLKVSEETWKEVMTIKLNEGYPSADKVLKDLLKLRKKK